MPHHGTLFVYMKKFLSIAHKSLAELGVATYKELWEKAQGEGYQGLTLGVSSTFTKVADQGETEQKHKFYAVFSSANEDRHGDVVHQNFTVRGPIPFIDSHNYNSIEYIIGSVHLKKKGKDQPLQGDVEFAVGHARGALGAYLAENKFLCATSIGFIPLEFNDKGEILKSELLEVSAVSVPANADAQFEKGAGSEAPESQPESKPEVPTNPEENGNTPVASAEPAPAPQKGINRKAIAAKAVSDMVEDRRKHLRLIARSVQELTDENKQEQKRKIYQVIRKLMEQ